MISPPGRDQSYPGRLPPVREQWGRLRPATRVGLLAGPLVVLGLIAVASPPAAATLAVLAVGMELATAVYIKNRTDRHNAAIDRGEITVVADPNFVDADRSQLPAAVTGRLQRDGMGPDDVGRVRRFDGGWIVRRRNPRDVAVVVGDDGGWARFDPRRVTDLWAVAEYRAGRGRED
ncbi:MAG TPA: hypothetical protein VFN68_06745 [Acidimicrobiales bacterium]|nr:hypothetical protein [Acidimicrobiales bacterium]